jgi:putative hydrolase of HD superfamily
LIHLRSQRNGKLCKDPYILIEDARVVLMTLDENIILMKTLLRTGWIRAGIPKSEIESLADHSWGVSILTLILCIEENKIRKAQKKKLLGIEKALSIALLHDFPESESMDLDKSIYPLIDPKELEDFIIKIESGAIRHIVNRTSPEVGRNFKTILTDKESPEYRLVRISDQIDLILQAKHYETKNWLKREDSDSFQNNALNKLNEYTEEFLFLSEYLEKLNPDG